MNVICPKQRAVVFMPNSQNLCRTCMVSFNTCLTVGPIQFSSLTTKELHGPTSPVGVELLIEKSAYLVPNDICQSSNFVLLLRLNMPPEHVSEVLVLSGNFSELFAVTFPLIGRIAGNRRPVYNAPM